MTACEAIGRWAAGLESRAIPADVLARARLQSAAQLAAARAGAEAAEPFAAAAPPGPVGEIYAGAAASIAHDWDDYLFAGHTGHSAVWAARAFGGEESLVAQVAANEIAGRLGAALFLGPHNGQFWSSIHCAGAAIAAGLGLGLDGARLAHALAIALYQPPYGLWPGFMGPETKLLTAAEPAAQGARAALLAAEGVEGALDVIESPRGLLTHMSFAPQPAMLGGLGEVWLTDTLAFKPSPGCAYLQSAVEAASRVEVAPAEIAAIEVEAGWLTCGMEELGRGPVLTPVRVTFSTALSVACVLHAGRLTHHELDPGWLGSNRAALLDLASRIGVRHDPELTMRSLRPAIEAGARPAGMALGDWMRVRRRMHELNMDELAIGRRELGVLAGRRTARRELAALLRAVRRPGGGRLEELDTRGMRMSFPCRLRVSLRSGRTLEVEGRERGSCGHPLAEQREVVEEKCRTVGTDPPAPIE